MSEIRPELSIRYSSDFFLTIRFSRVQRYEVGYSEYYFEFACRMSHSKGEFTYSGRDICFDHQMFRNFVGQLEAIQKGQAQHAELHEVGHTIVLALDTEGRKARASLKIREFQPPAEETLLTAGFPVDYDLFVYSLHTQASEFAQQLESLGHA
jgi:hypothetical protein